MSSHCCPPEKKWYESKLNQAAIASVISIFLVSYGLKDRGLLQYASMYVQEMWWAVLLGLAVGGIIEYCIPHQYIEKYLSQPKKRTLLTAALLGTMLSTCSHGILAISMQLYKKGASIPSIIVLLTAAPWANFPITILLIKFFGLNAFIMIALAILIALITGYIFQKLDNRHLLDHCPPHNFSKIQAFSITDDIKKRFKAHSFTWSQLKTDITGIYTGIQDLSSMLMGWFVLALVMASYIGHYVPTQLFHQYFSTNALGIFNTLLGATVIEVCSEGSSVLAFELYKNTQALGNTLVFLLAGVATDYTEIGLIWTTIGKRSAILLPIISVPLILLAGVLLNICL